MHFLNCWALDIVGFNEGHYIHCIKPIFPGHDLGLVFFWEFAEWINVLLKITYRGCSKLSTHKKLVCFFWIFSSPKHFLWPATTTKYIKILVELTIFWVHVVRNLFQINKCERLQICIMNSVLVKKIFSFSFIIDQHHTLKYWRHFPGK